MTLHRVAAALSILLLACAHEPTPPRHAASVSPSGAAWREGRRVLLRLREAWQPTAGTMRLGVKIHHAPSGLTMQGRGALARRPPDALRMVLVGPGGLTALDFWSRGDRWRFAIPSQDLTVRGDEDTAPEAQRGLPVSFLRWWLLRPLDGELVAVHTHDSGREMVLRHEAATLQVRPLPSGGLQVTRRKGANTEIVKASAPGCTTASYEHVQAGLRVDVACESWESEQGRLSASVFEDPDGR